MLALESGHWRLVQTFGDGDEMRAPPFEAVTIRASDLWPVPLAPE